MAVEVDKNGEFWQYLSQTQKDLIGEGYFLLNDVIRHHAYNFKDYSFLVFPFAKAFEGFLKQLFKDVKFISHLDYISDHLRLGKLMSPNLQMKLGNRSLYTMMEAAVDGIFAERVWLTWKTGRNQIFHYFPHNLKAISFTEAEKIIEEILLTMQQAYIKLKTEDRK